MSGSSHIPHPSSLTPWHQRAGFDIQEFSASGIRTFAVVEGRSGQVPVIFLHGFPGGAFLWEFVIAALGRKRLAIAPDFPGWGGSVTRHATLPSPTPEWSLEWLNGLLAAQQVERFDLVAHGDAVWMALGLLGEHPQRVRRLGLVSARLWETSTVNLVSRLREHFSTPQVWSPEKVHKWLGEHAAITKDAQRRRTQEFAEQVRFHPAVLRHRPYEAHLETYLRALTDFQGTVLLMWGENDPAYSQRESEKLTAGLDRPEVHRIADAGHYPMLDQPQQVTPIMKELLED